MSYSAEPLETLITRDPRVKIDSKRVYTVHKGAQQNSFRPVVSTSYSNNEINFSAVPPSDRTIIDRKLCVRWRPRITITGVNNTPGAPLIDYGVTDCIRAFPLASITSSLKLSINNTNFTVNANDVFPQLFRYYTYQEDDDMEYSTFPAQQDQYSSYSTKPASIRNAFSKYESSNAYTNPRGAYPILSFTNAVDANTSEIVFEFCEPLFLSPLIFGCGEESGFIHINNLEVELNLNNQARLWCHDASAANTISSVVLSLDTAPELLVNYLTPQLLADIPASVTYPFFNLERFTLEAAGIAPGANFSIRSNAIKLNSIPSRMYIYAKRSRTEQNSSVANAISTTDTFAFIRGVQIDYANQSALLSTARPQDLYRMSVRNGCKLSWSQWSGAAIPNGVSTSGLLDGNNPPSFIGGVGSILCVDYGQDLPQQQLDAPGKLGEYMLQVNADFTDLRPAGEANYTYSLYIVLVNEGVVTIANNLTVQNIGVLSDRNILDSAQMPEADYNTIKSIYGGKSNFMQGVRKFFSKASDIYRQAKPILSAAADVAQMIPEVAPFATVGRKVLGVGGRGGKVVGAGLQGGKMMPKSRLSQRLARMEEDDSIHSEF
jgi:hypothetical protein